MIFRENSSHPLVKQSLCVYNMLRTEKPFVLYSPKSQPEISRTWEFGMGVLAMRRTFFFLIVSSLLVFTTSAIPVSAQSWFPQPQKRLSIGGSLVDALADFQRQGGQVDEVLTPEDLAGKPPLIYGIQNGRSVFAISGGRDGGLAGLVTVDGSSVEASVTPDGFLELKPDQTGVRNRNLQLFWYGLRFIDCAPFALSQNSGIWFHGSIHVSFIERLPF